MLKRLVAVLFVLALAGCDSLPNDVEQQASRIDRGITSLEETLTSRRADYNAMQNDSEQWTFFQPYAEREDWATTFDEVEADLARLRDRYDSEVTPILEADKSDDAERLQTVLDSIAANFDPTRDRMNAVNARMALLQEGYENAPTWITEARSFVEQIEAAVASVQSDREQAKADFPDRADAIDERFRVGNGTEEGDYPGLGNLQADAVAALATVEAEFAKHEAGQDADYAAFADAYATTRDNAAAAVLAAEAYAADLQSLYEEYTTVLRDMKIEYVVEIGRSVWNSGSDARYPDATYPATTISQDSYEYLTGLAPGERQGQSDFLARRYSSWGSWENEVFIDQAVWREIGINMGASWDSRTNDSQFWINDIYPVYFHRYAEVNGTEVTQGEWEEVDESTFGLYADAFGMAIEQKALGRFADEAIAEPAPAGIDMVGDPRYGEWVPDGNGGQQWSWLEAYAFYHLFLGPDPYYYSRNDYNSYNSWRDDRRGRSSVTAANYGWYGSNRSSPTYGTNGRATAQTATFRNSPFASSGGAQRIPASVRNAGATARSRGPGGAGK